MPSTIEVLPAELFLEIVKELRAHDLANLMRVSRTFHQGIEPILWNKIEFHRDGFHEDYVHKQLKDEQIALHRPYRGLYDRKAAKFLRMLQDLEYRDSVRAQRLKGLVKWLCLHIDAYAKKDESAEVWSTLASFKNLEHLELSASWTGKYKSHRFQLPERPLSSLHTLKLCGYVPAPVAQYLLKSAPTINDLWFGLLDAPVTFTRDTNPPPSPPEKYKHLSDDELYDLNAEDYEYFSGEWCAPRPLPCLEDEFSFKFTTLTRLYLIRPSNSGCSDDILYNSDKSDKAMLRQWASLLGTVRRTLAHLTLDHCPSANEDEPDGTGNNEFMRIYCNGPGYHQFVEIVLPVLLSGDWPELKTIWLFGFESDGKAMEYYNGPVGYMGTGVNIPGQLKKKFPDAGIQSSLGRRTLVWNDTGEIMSNGDIFDSYNGVSDDSEDEDSEDEDEDM